MNVNVGPVRQFCAHATGWNQCAAKSLSSRWSRDGVVWPLTVLPASEARSLGKRLVSQIGNTKRFKENELMYYKSHLVFGVVNELARNQAILAHVSTILDSKDLLLWDSSVPIKPPVASAESGGFFPWHQDGTYWGLQPLDGVVTCWVALSTASKLHGCMRVVPGSHKQGQVSHNLNPTPSAMVRRGQTVDGIDEATARHVELQAGEMSMHHGLVLHASDANRSPEDRIGVVLNFVRPSTKPHTGVGSATLVAGSCDVPHWLMSNHLPKPDQTPDAASLQAHTEALSTHRGELRASELHAN